MSTQYVRQFSRRRFLGGVTLAGTAGLLGVPLRPVAAEPPPETTRIRMVYPDISVCPIPQFVAEELLQSEGFTDVQYVQVGPGLDYTKLVAGDVDFAMRFVGSGIVQIDAGEPVLLLAGVHIGCYELFGTDRVRSLRDLKGKKVGVPSLQDSRYLFVASAAAYVGLDPRQDIDWVTQPTAELMRLFTEGKIDAFLGFPPEPQELRAQQIGHVLVNTAVDRPWSQYFCCMLVASPKFVRAHPVATKRAVRAILKAADICALDPERGARFLVEKGLTPRYDYALQAIQAIQELPYNKWHEYDAEDTVRFYALRLHEIGLIKSTPQKIIAQGTDWRFFNALKKELKG